MSPLDDELIGHLDCPAQTSPKDLFRVSGWIFSRNRPIRALTVRHTSGWRFPLIYPTPRPDVADAYPAIAGALSSGFHSSGPITSIFKQGRLEVWASFDDGTDLAVFRVQRGPDGHIYPGVIRTPARQVFLDCGTHYGEGLRDFARRLPIDAGWEIHCFEANPDCWWYYDKNRLLDVPNLTIHRQAVWVEDGMIDLHREDHAVSGSGSPIVGDSTLDGWASSIVTGNTFPGLGQPIGVPCVDLSRFVGSIARSADRFVIKLDVEGAEYAILRKMMQDDTLRHVHELYVEYHFPFVPGESYESTLQLKAEMATKFPALALFDWD
jgi:FkbM family methyltransferase